MELFWQIHRDIPREGPGSEEYTLKALSLIKSKEQMNRIVDIGCGPGMQTLTLAINTGAEVTAVDTHQPFLDRLAVMVKKEKLEGRIRIQNVSMFELPFKEGAFDVVWSEGAIFIIGFERGLKEWRRLVRPGGYIVVSEATWLCTKEQAPKECREFWDGAYPTMGTIGENIEAAFNLGYKLIGTLVLPEACWWEYYTPLEKNIKALLRQHPDDNKIKAFIEEEYREIEIYTKYKDYYGYVFYIFQRKEDT